MEARRHPGVVSDIASFSMAGDILDQNLIRNARFDAYRASPCSQYHAQPGWRPIATKTTPIAKATTICVIPTSHADSGVDDDDHRRGLPWKAGDHRAPPVGAAAISLLSTNGTPDVTDWLHRRLERQVAWSVFSVGVSLLVVSSHMYAALRRDEFRTVSQALDGGLWRAAATMAPFIAIAWPFDGPGFMPVALFGRSRPR